MWACRIQCSNRKNLLSKMRKIFTVFISLLVASCLSEQSADPGKAATFIRYFNGGNNDQAQAFEETPDKGFIILANTRIQKAEADIPHFKIKLIKTDQYGNPVWVKLFPAIDDNSKDYTGSGLQLIPNGGYIISGVDIKSSVNKKSLVMTVGDDGNLIKAASYGALLSGRAVAVNAAGNFLILSTTGIETMRLTEMDKSTLAPVVPADTAITYGAGQTELTNKLFIDEAGKVLWSGIVTKNGLTGIRMIKTIPHNINTEFDLLISVPGFDETASDFCRFGYSYAITGSTNQKGAIKGTDTDILFKRLAPDGTVLSSQSFPFGDGTTPDGQNDVGNSIRSTQDGGLILLSSVGSAAIKGNGDTDYYLIKINAFGDKVWSSSFGSRFKDDGVAVLQSSDGGYMVLGTTTQGALKLVTLIKTDKNGKVE